MNPSRPSTTVVPDEVQGALLCLTPDEAAFLDAAFARILGDGCLEQGSVYVDLRLWQAERFARTAPAGRVPHAGDADGLAGYRARIGAAQDLALRRHGRRFQHLGVAEQDALLQLLETDDASSGLQGCGGLTDRLVSDAAEAYFSRPVDSEPHPRQVAS